METFEGEVAAQREIGELKEIKRAARQKRIKELCRGRLLGTAALEPKLRFSRRRTRGGGECKTERPYAGKRFNVSLWQLSRFPLPHPKGSPAGETSRMKKRVLEQRIPR